MAETEAHIAARNGDVKRLRQLGGGGIERDNEGRTAKDYATSPDVAAACDGILADDEAPNAAKPPLADAPLPFGEASHDKIAHGLDGVAKTAPAPDRQNPFAKRGRPKPIS